MVVVVVVVVEVACEAVKDAARSAAMRFAVDLDPIAPGAPSRIGDTGPVFVCVRVCVGRSDGGGESGLSYLA